MKQLDVESREQSFVWDGFTINLRYNEFDEYWFYDITSEEKSRYGIALYVNEFALKNMTYEDMPMLVLVDSEPENENPYSLTDDIGGRLKLILLTKEDFE